MTPTEPVREIRVRWAMRPGPVGWTVGVTLAFLLSVAAGVALRTALS